MVKEEQDLDFIGEEETGDSQEEIGETEENTSEDNSEQLFNTPTGSNGKKMNPSEYFYETYGESFAKLVATPMVACCRERDEYIPYDYTNKSIRFRRNIPELEDCLRNEATSLAIYCIKNKIDKNILATCSGGNLYDYYMMRKSFGQF